MKTHSKQRRDKKKKIHLLMDHSCLLGKSPSRRKKVKSWFFSWEVFLPPQIEMAPLPLSPKYFSADFFLQKRRSVRPACHRRLFLGGKKTWERVRWRRMIFFRSWRKDISLQGCVGLPPFKETGRRFFFKKKYGGNHCERREFVTSIPPLIIPSHERM